MVGSYSAVRVFILFTLSLTGVPKYGNSSSQEPIHQTLLGEGYTYSRSSFMLSSLSAMGLGIDLGTDKAAVARALGLDF